MPTIVSQIEHAQTEIAACESRLDKLERRLRLSELSQEQRDSLQKEEKELKKRLSDKEKVLSSLRKENGRTAVLSVIIVGIVALVYYAFWSP